MTVSRNRVNDSARKSEMFDDPADAAVAVVAGADDVLNAVDNIEANAVDDHLGQLAHAPETIPA